MTLLCNIIDLLVIEATDFGQLGLRSAVDSSLRTHLGCLKEILLRKIK